MSKIFIAEDGKRHVFPNEATEQQIADAMGVAPPGTHMGRQPVTVKSRAGETRIPKNLAGHYQKHGFGEQLRDAALDAMVPVGGAAGGILGGTAGLALSGGNPIGAAAGAMGGAGLGGTLAGNARAGLESMLGVEGAPQSFVEGVQRGTDAGQEQAQLELVGRTGAEAVKLLGRPLMAAALRYTPDVAKIAITERITATKGGMDKLMVKIGEAGNATRRLLAEATRGNPAAGMPGVRYNTTQHLIVPIGPDFFTKIQEQALSQKETAAAQRMFQEFQRSHPGNVTPLELNEIVKNSDAIADPLWKAVQRKEQITPRDALRMRFHKAIADNGRQLLRDTVPGVEEAKARSQSLKMLKEAVADALKPTHGFGARLAQRGSGMAMGAGIGAFSGGGSWQERSARIGAGAVGGAMLGSPAFMSSLAVGLNQPVLEHIIRQTPRAIAWPSGGSRK